MSTNPACQFEFIDDMTGFRAPNTYIACLSGPLRRKQDLLRALAVELKLPGYFGYNWDALEECLSDLSWLGADVPIALLHEQLPLADERQRKTYIDILQRAQQVHQGRLRIIFPAKVAGELRLW